MSLPQEFPSWRNPQSRGLRARVSWCSGVRRELIVAWKPANMPCEHRRASQEEKGSPSSACFAALALPHSSLLFFSQNWFLLCEGGKQEHYFRTVRAVSAADVVALGTCPLWRRECGQRATVLRKGVCGHTPWRQVDPSTEAHRPSHASDAPRTPALCLWQDTAQSSNQHLLCISFIKHSLFNSMKCHLLCPSPELPLSLNCRTWSIHGFREIFTAEPDNQDTILFLIFQPERKTGRAFWKNSHYPIPNQKMFSEAQRKKLEMWHKSELLCPRRRDLCAPAPLETPSWWHLQKRMCLWEYGVLLLSFCGNPGSRRLQKLPSRWARLYQQPRAPQVFHSPSSGMRECHNFSVLLKMVRKLGEKICGLWERFEMTGESCCNIDQTARDRVGTQTLQGAVNKGREHCWEARWDRWPPKTPTPKRRAAVKQLAHPQPPPQSLSELT